MPAIIIQISLNVLQPLTVLNMHTVVNCINGTDKALACDILILARLHGCMTILNLHTEQCELIVPSSDPLLILFSPQPVIKKHIGCILDMDKGTLEFEFDSVYLGVAFTDLPTDQPLYPTISAVYGNSEISLIYMGKPIVG